MNEYVHTANEQSIHLLQDTLEEYLARIQNQARQRAFHTILVIERGAMAMALRSISKSTGTVNQFNTFFIK